jgi:hypothetical protein
VRLAWREAWSWLGGAPPCGGLRRAGRRALAVLRVLLEGGRLGMPSGHRDGWWCPGGAFFGLVLVGAEL